MTPQASQNMSQPLDERYLHEPYEEKAPIVEVRGGSYIVRTKLRPGFAPQSSLT